MADSSADRNPLDRLAEEFVERLRSGQRPALSEYADRHPELAGEIRDLFPALVEMEQLKPGAGEHTGDFESESEPTDPDRVGEFRIVRRVGHGGMGVVYEAVQESLGRHVALKLLPSEAVADPKRLERFRREAKSAARLHHTNIVPVFGVGEADRRHYYAMQFIDGHPIDLVIDEVRRLKDQSAAGLPRAVSEVAAAMVTGTFVRTGEVHEPAPPPSSASNADLSRSSAFSSNLTDNGRHYWNTVARLGAQVADALAYAHGQGILHRDIKPANLLLDLHGTVWVTDFGLAKAADSDDLTHVGDVVGTLRYMAPERFDGPGDSRADTYALGLTLYEMLTLRPAFTAENRAKLVQEVTAASPPTPRSINASIPRDLETIVLKAIARDPAMRYQSASELAEDLNRYLEDRPIRARRASRTEQAWRWCRRNPAVAGLLAAVLVVLTAGAVVSGVFALQAEQKEHEARQSAQQAIDAAERADQEKSEAENARKQAADAADFAKLAAEHATDESSKLKTEQDRISLMLYVSQINHAQAAVNELRTFWALKALAQTDPRLRGWEWNYLDRATHLWESEVQPTLPAAGPGRTSQFSITHQSRFTADGTKLVVTSPSSRAGGDSLTVQIFDTGTGAGSARTSPSGRQAAASPNQIYAAEVETDITQVASHTVRVYDVQSNATVPLVLPPFEHVRRIWLSDRGDRVTVVAATPVPRGDRRGIQLVDPFLVTARRGSIWPRVQEIRTGPDNRLAAPDHLACDDTVAITSYALGQNGKPLDESSTELARSRLFEFWDLAPNPPRRLGRVQVASPTRPIQALSANGTRFAVLDGDNDVLTFDCRTGTSSGRWTLPAELRAARDLAGQFIQRVAVSDDGARVVLVAGEQTMFVGDKSGDTWRSFVLRGPEEIAPLPSTATPFRPRSTGSAIESLWLSPDGNRLLTFDQRVRVWNLAANPDYVRTWPLSLKGDSGWSQANVKPSETGRWVVYSEWGPGGPPTAPGKPGVGAVSILNVETGAERRLETGPGTISQAVVSLDGRRLLEPKWSARGMQFRLHALDDEDDRVLWTSEIVPSNFVGGRGVGPKMTKGWLVEPLFVDRTPKALSPGNAFTVAALHARFGIPTPAVDVAPPPRPLASANNGFTALAGAVRTAPRLQPSGGFGGFGGAPGGKEGIPTLAGLRFYDPETGNLLAELSGAGFIAVEEGSPDGRHALIASRGQGNLFTVSCFEPAARQKKWDWSPEPDGTKTNGKVGAAPVLDLFHGGNGRYVGVVRGSDVWVLDAAAGREVRHFRLNGMTVSTVSFGPDGWMIFGGGRTSVVWNMAEKEPAVRLDGHEQAVGRAQFSPDGKRLFTLERDPLAEGRPAAVRVWDLSGGRLLLTLRVPKALGPMWFEADRLMVLCQDGIRVFDGSPRRDEPPLPDGEPDINATYLPNLSAAEYTAVLHLVEKRKNRNPDSARDWREYGSALFRLKRHDEALAALEKALVLSGDAPSAPLLAFLAMARAERHDIDGAKQIIEKLRARLATRPFSQFMIDLAAEAEMLFAKRELELKLKRTAIEPKKK